MNTQARLCIALAATAALMASSACQQQEAPRPEPFLGASPNNDTPSPNNDPRPEPEPDEEILEGEGDLRGYVVSSSGEPLDGVSIRVQGRDYDETTVSGEGGHFELIDVSYGQISIEIEPGSFVPLHRQMKHNDDNAGHFFDFVLHPSTTESFPSETGGTIVLGDAGVTLPGGGYVAMDDGEPITGQLTVRAAYFDPTDPGHLRAAPPLYRLAPEEGASRLVSLGMVDVTLFIDGRPAQLGEGRTATIDLPLDAVDGLVGGSTSIPAWYYDVETALWVREGLGQVVTRGTSGKRWVAQVSHFTTWNADYTDDDDCEDAAVLRMRQCGSDVGACLPGLYRCLSTGSTMRLFDGRGGDASICDGATGPGTEVCDGIDNNCNSATDESFTGKGDTCYTGPEEVRGVGRCLEGRITCQGSGEDLGDNLTCDGQVLPEDEACDGEDSDCDGAIDEEDPDACGDSAQCIRQEGAWICIQR